MPASAGAFPGSFSARLEAALALALSAHDGQARKGDAGLPYAVHPLHVAWIARAYSADEDVWVAALLHDVVEDSQVGHDELARRFGSRVAAVVAELTEDKGLDWQARKEGGIEAAARLTPEAALVKACDKLHNLASLAHELERASDRSALWARFSGGREGTLTVARRLAAALAPRVPEALAVALVEAVEHLERVARELPPVLERPDRL